MGCMYKGLVGSCGWWGGWTAGGELQPPTGWQLLKQGLDWDWTGTFIGFLCSFINFLTTPVWVVIFEGLYFHSLGS